MMRVAIILVAASVSVLAQDVDFDDKTCGRQLVPAEGLIKHGFQSRPGEWPWHVALFHRMANGVDFDYQCGGTLVHKYLVMTAAHCVTLRSSRKVKNPADILAKVGRFNISEQHEEQGRDHEVSQIVMHRDYKPLTFENDIAILKLKVPTILTAYVQPVCLWKRDDGKPLPTFHRSLGTVVGWGLTENNTVAMTLNKAEIPVVDIYECLESDRSFFGHLVNARTYCAGFTNGTGVCNGDSGGGMFFKEAKQWYLRGVVSFSSISDSTRLCNLKKYVGFTDAARYLQWIYENAPLERSDDPILGHPNVRLINQGECGVNRFAFEYEEENKPVIKQYPWMAALRHPFQNHQHVPCNGVLINKNYILTTTCVDFEDEVSVTLGDYNTNEVRDCLPLKDDRGFCLDPVQMTTVAEFFLKDRLVLARLSNPAFIGRRDHIQAICLPVAPEQRDQSHARLTLTGWKESGQDSLFLQRAVVDLIPRKTCRDEMTNVTYASDEEKNITDAIICVRNPADPNRSPRCEDYQPGSAIQAIDQKSNRYVLYGAQTGISYCSKPERFIAVASYLEWMLDHIKP